MYSAQVRNGLTNPCQKSTGSTGESGTSSGGRYWGPYTYQDGKSTRFVGYSPRSLPASSGLSYDVKKGTYGSFKAPGVSRGGFTTSSRVGGSLGGQGVPTHAPWGLHISWRPRKGKIRRAVVYSVM